MTLLLHAAISNAALAGLLALLLLPLARLSRRPALTHAACVLVLLKLVTPPLFHVPLPWPQHRQTNAPAPAVVELPPVGSSDQFADPEPGDASMPLPAVTSPPAPPAYHVSWQLVIGLPWLAGSVLCLAMVACRVRSLRRLARLGTDADEQVVRQTGHLAGRLGLGAAPAVTFIPGGAPPMMLALFARPRLLIPSRFWDRLDPTQRQTLLVHELAHLRRRDHWVRYLETAVTVLYWWYPLAWWARRELREAEEQCCDAWVVSAMPQSVRQYMATLLDAVEFLCDRHRPAAATPVVASGMGQFHCLERRLRMVKQHAMSRSLSRGGRLAVVALAALLPLAPSPARSQQADPTADAPPAAATADAPGDRTMAVYKLNNVKANEAADAFRRIYPEQYPSQKFEIAADDRTNSVVVTVPGHMETVAQVLNQIDTGAPDSPGSKADASDIEKARERVRALTQELNEAKLRLDRLEGRKPGGAAEQLGRWLRAGQAPNSDYLELRVGQGHVDAIDRGSGKQLWQFKVDDANQVPAAKGLGRRVEVAVGDHVYFLEARTGKVLSERVQGPRGERRAAPDARPSDDQERRLRAVEEKLDRLLRAMEQDHANKGQPARPDAPGM